MSVRELLLHTCRQTDGERRSRLQPSRAERTIQPDFLTSGSTAPLQKQCSPYLAQALPTVHPFTVSTLSLVYSLYSNRVQLLNWGRSNYNIVTIRDERC